MLGSDQFKTIKKATEGAVYKEKGSKFIGFAFPVNSEEEVKARLEEIKRTHHQASHFCYAYQLGFPNPEYRVNDDGEPNNSAGKPILGQIHSAELTDILLIVIRFYGGTKLGVGGLIQAYKTAAQYCLEECKIIVKTLFTRFELNFQYPLLNTVMRFIKENHLELIEQKMAESCSIRVGVRKGEAKEVKKRLQAIYGLEIKPV